MNTFGSLNHYRKNIASLLLIAILVMSIPRNYFHAIIHHEEHEVVHEFGQHTTEVGIAHEHCQLLQYSLPSMDHFLPVFNLTIESNLPHYYFSGIVFDFSTILFSKDLRGPPLA